MTMKKADLDAVSDADMIEALRRTLAQDKGPDGTTARIAGIRRPFFDELIHTIETIADEE
jgi:hypothetical protein